MGRWRWVNMATRSGRPRGKASGFPQGARACSPRAAIALIRSDCAMLHRGGLGGLFRFALIFAMCAVPWLPLVCQQTAPTATLPPSLEPVFSGFEPGQSSDYGLVYVPLDSWVYPAFERLFSLGYADSAYLGMRPWTRTSCLQILQETYPKLQDAPQDEEAWSIFQALALEFGVDAGQRTTSAELRNVYTRNMYI